MSIYDQTKTLFLLIALELDIPTLINFCLAKPEHRLAACNNPIFWDQKLRRDPKVMTKALIEAAQKRDHETFDYLLPKVELSSYDEFGKFVLAIIISEDAYLYEKLYEHFYERCSDECLFRYSLAANNIPFLKFLITKNMLRWEAIRNEISSLRRDVSKTFKETALRAKDINMDIWSLLHRYDTNPDGGLRIAAAKSERHLIDIFLSKGATDIDGAIKRAKNPRIVNYLESVRNLPRKELSYDEYITLLRISLYQD